jgi:LPS export ABC transporter protein LptC
MRNLLLIAILSLGLLACSKTETPQPVGDSVNLPDSRLDDATIVFTEDGRQSVVVKAAHIDRWERQDSTEAQTVTVLFYDTLGVQKSTLTGKRGLIREKSEKVAMFGDVVAVNEDSTVLKTESLFWDPQTNLITTDDYVEVTRKDGDVITGYGLKADRHLKEIEILSDVAGKVSNVAEQEKEKFEQK